MKKIKSIRHKFVFIFSILRDIILTVLNIKFKPSQRLNPSKITRWAVSVSSKHVCGLRNIDCNKNELIILCLVRNGQDYIKQFIDHYFKLGAKHIVFLDNGSNDHTVSIAKEYDNVTILQTKLPYRTYAWAYKPYLINRFGKKCWCLVADIDEFFDYPYSDRFCLSSLLKYLNRNNYNAVITQILDMFSDKPVITQNKKNENFKKYFKYYDRSIIDKLELLGDNEVSNKNIKYHINGIRKKIFGMDNLYLSKYSLLNIKDNLTVDNYTTHFIANNARLADFSCVFYHYIFGSNLLNKCKTALKEKNYWSDSSQYKKIFDVLKSKQSVNIYNLAPQPKMLNNVNDLVDNSFLKVSEEYLKEVNYFRN